MFDIVKIADLRQGELAKLVGVSRVTINFWINGKAKPNKLASAKLHSVLEQLREALEAGRLPLPKSAGKTGQRDSAIAAALQPIDR